jgi:Taurine catabolism dioxygenase TauD, TfdA family
LVFPPRDGQVLRAVELPPSGGDTLWCSTGAAFDALGPELQRFVCGLTAVHDLTYFFRRVGHFDRLKCEQNGFDLISRNPPRIPEEWAPRSVAEAYAMQDRFAEEPGVPVVGHKVGCASGASQRLMRTDGPIAGRILADECFADGATLPASRFFGVGVEAEFAFLMGVGAQIG